LLWAIMCIVWARKEIWRDSWHSVGDKIVLSLFTFVFFLVVATMPVMIITNIFPDKVEKWSADCGTLVSLRNSNETRGDFVLGTGEIEGVEYLYAMKESDGLYNRFKIRMSDVTLKESSDLNTTAELYCNKVYNFGHYMIDGDDCLLVVPKGTILKHMRIE
jgi:hypothetical protein